MAENMTKYVVLLLLAIISQLFISHVKGQGQADTTADPAGSGSSTADTTADPAGSSTADTTGSSTADTTADPATDPASTTDATAPSDKDPVSAAPKDEKNTTANEPVSAAPKDEKNTTAKEPEEVLLPIDPDSEPPENVVQDRDGNPLTTMFETLITLPDKSSIRLKSPSWMTYLTMARTKPGCLCLTRGPLSPFKLFGNLHFKSIKSKHHTQMGFIDTTTRATTCPPCNCPKCY